MTILYELPKATHATLTVYDLLGREVAVLVDGIEGPDYKSVEWNTSLPAPTQSARAGKRRGERGVLESAHRLGFCPDPQGFVADVTFTTVVQAQEPRQRYLGFALSCRNGSRIQ